MSPPRRTHHWRAHHCTREAPARLGDDSYNYTRGFAGVLFQRGQHADRYNVDPIDPPLPAAPHKLKNVASTKLYLRNTADRVYERDWLHGRTLSTTFDWLERNVLAENPEVAATLHRAFVGFLAEAGAPAERTRLYTEPQPALSLGDGARLFAVCDPSGLWLAYPTEAEAAICLASLPPQTIQEVRFGDLLGRQPRALVHLHEQYYRAEDITV